MGTVVGESTIETGHDGLRRLEGHRFTGGEGKPVTLDDHGRGARFRTGESAMNLTWRFSDAELASLALPAE